jgi:hypothetical protein
LYYNSANISKRKLKQILKNKTSNSEEKTFSSLEIVFSLWMLWPFVSLPEAAHENAKAFHE